MKTNDLLRILLLLFQKWNKTHKPVQAQGNRWYECAVSGTRNCGRTGLDIQKVLSELRHERKQLNAAIHALEALQKQGRARTQIASSLKSGDGRSRKNRVKKSERNNPVDRGADSSNKVISFPAVRRSGS